MYRYDYRHPIDRSVLLCQTHVGRVPSRTGQVAERKEGKGGQTMNTTYQTLIVKFSEPITALDGIFDDTGREERTPSKGWIDDYESTFHRHRQPYGSHHEQYNMECVKEWLQRQTPISEMREF